MFAGRRVVWGELGEGLPPSQNLLKEAHAALESMITVTCRTDVTEDLLIPGDKSIYCQELTFQKALSEPSRIRLAVITMQTLAEMINRGNHDASFTCEIPGWVDDNDVECKTLDGGLACGGKVNLRLIVSESPKSANSLLLRFGVLMGKVSSRSLEVACQ